MRRPAAQMRRPVAQLNWRTSHLGQEPGAGAQGQQRPYVKHGHKRKPDEGHINNTLSMFAIGASWLQGFVMFLFMVRVAW